MRRVSVGLFWTGRRQRTASLLTCFWILGVANVSFGQADRVGGLINQLKDRDPYARGNAAEALGAIKDTRALEPLIVALQDSDSNVRQMAANALGEVKDSRAIGPLTDELQDPDPNVREMATWALEQIKGSNFSASSPADRALIHFYHRCKVSAKAISVFGKDPCFSAASTNIYVDHHFLGAPDQGTYTTHEVLVTSSVPVTVSFTYMEWFRPEIRTGCERPGCVVIVRYGPPKLLTHTLLQIQVEGGKTYYVQYGKGLMGLKLMPEATGAKEMKGLSPDVPIFTPAHN